jgi:hypothetical protein
MCAAAGERRMPANGTSTGRARFSDGHGVAIAG